MHEAALEADAMLDGLAMVFENRGHDTGDSEALALSFILRDVRARVEPFMTLTSPSPAVTQD
jgi:hypothetical protein